MVKVEGAKNFGIGLGLIVEDALFAIRLDFTIFQVVLQSFLQPSVSGRNIERSFICSTSSVS